MKNIIYKYQLPKPIKNQVIKKIKEYEKKIKREVFINNPFFEFENYLKNPDKEIIKIYQQYEKFAKTFKIPFNKSFWQKELKKTKELKLTKKLILDNFQKDLYKEKTKWELEEIQRLKEEYINKIKNWLKLLEKLSTKLNSLLTGILWDLSETNLLEYDIKIVQKYLEFLDKEEIKNLLDLLGRMRSVKKELQTITALKKETYENIIPNFNLKEEIIGIKISNDIENVLPHELALLQDEDLSILFDKKFVESQLMCFDLISYNKEIEQKEIEYKKQIEKKEKLGPIILCIDTSGSMNGTPENIAKAITLFMANKAKEQNRDCLLINFSTNIEVFEFDEKVGVEKLIKFLKKSFHGGTDVAPALEYAIEKMKKEKYNKADVLVISDFMMRNIPTSLQEKIQKLKQNKNRFFSLIIGSYFLDKQLEKMFDREWVYNPATHSIKELVKYLDI